jgi:hypothetical protein
MLPVKIMHQKKMHHNPKSEVSVKKAALSPALPMRTSPN